MAEEKSKFNILEIPYPGITPLTLYFCKTSRRWKENAAIGGNQANTSSHISQVYVPLLMHGENPDAVDDLRQVLHETSGAETEFASIGYSVASRKVVRLKVLGVEVIVVVMGVVMS